ncbi:hypothetical protein [Mycolicibacterium nivoides]|uniref:hypothetical protein n=1 Tax=Mycolicibacterium nivoides TaxID=2487344 RepID=UPI003C2E7582
MPKFKVSKRIALSPMAGFPIGRDSTADQRQQELTSQWAVIWLTAAMLHTIYGDPGMSMSAVGGQLVLVRGHEIARPVPLESAGV